MIDKFLELDVLLQLESIRCEREAMIIFNLERQNHGYAPGYDEATFMGLVTRLEQIRGRIRG